ncbi:SMI1/KNR4 family protein [Kitasatospora sp. NPDC002040]|uniref:SMI1/KNR4 family protein n=1 Tax=Kitasatospora sp. NPDC002040 TaxID=3154661 RepID=UPI00331B9528
MSRLGELLGPPTRRPAQVPWESAADAHPGLRFPADYRWLIDTYGSIRIHEDLLVSGPTRSGFYGEGFAGFLAMTADAYDQAEQFHEEPRFPEIAPEPPHPMFPEPGGLLSWGGDTFGNYYFWLTQDPDPNRWPVVVWFGENEVWDVFDGGLAAFLAALLASEYHMTHEIPLRSGPVHRFAGDWEGFVG